MLVSQANLKSLSKYFATLLPLYNIPSKNRISKNIMDLQFKRIPKFGQTKNIREYIKSQLSLDIPILDILLDLQEYGLDEAEVREYLEEIQTEQEKIVERRKKDIRNIGLIMHLSIVSFGIQINIDNASSMFDIHNALAWTRAAILAWRTETPIEKTKVALVSEEKVEEEEKIVVTIPSRLSSVSSTGSELSIGSEDEFMGGAIGKEYNRYFNNLLKQLDPTIFTLTENYARKCQVADFRQPIGISKKQKDFIDSSIYKDGYDNSIEYGSDPNKTNIYICPRVWCPKSQVPLSPELYEKNQGKCPREDEEPMLLYKHATWYNDINRPHYVGFLKERGFNNVKLPCCFKKQQTIMNTSVKEKEGDSYIIDRVKNIQESRFGTIPLALHEFLYPNVPYQLCRNTVKTDECLLRRGIATSKDSFLTSIAYLMNFDSKSDLVKHIQKELTPEVFISLENGLVYQTFQSENTLFIEKDLKLRQQLHDWLLSYPKYLQLYDLNDILSLLQKDSIDDLPLNVRYKMARQLSIMDSYLQFMNYIQEDNEKNPHMFFDLFHHLGFLIIVWNRDASSIATLKCPFASKLKQWLMGSHKLLPCLLLMSFESSYEPLILVDPSKNITQKIMFTKYAKLESFLLQCPTFHTNEDIWIQKLYSLEQWTEHMLINPNAFKINRIILDYNYRICAFVTKGLLWIDIPEHLSIGSISYIMNALPIQHISYWEDIESTLWDIQCNHQDYALWRLKLKSFDFGTKSGEVRQVNYRLHMLFKVPKVVYPDLPKVPIVLQDVFINRLDTIESDNSEWFTTKKYILSKLISKYDSWVKPLLKVATKERLDKLYEHFEHLQQIARVTVLLEELPIDNLEQLKKIYQDLLLDKPYYHIPENLYEGYRNKEWIFTQHTLSAKDMTFVKQPSISYNIDIFPKENQETLQQVSTKVATPPDMMIESKCDVIHLPTKWRAAVWKEYTIYILKSYTKTSLLDLLQWLAEQTYQYWDVRDLQMYIKKQYFDLLENREQYPKLFEDPSMRLAWNNILQRQYRNVNELIQNGLAPLSIEEIQQKWIDVLSSQQDTLWIQDLDLYHLSRLFKLSFLVIIKGKSTTKKEDDITSSVKYICGFQYSEWKYRPMLTLYKQLSDDKSHYIYGLMKKNKKSFYRQAIEAPEELLEIIEHIIQK